MGRHTAAQPFNPRLLLVFIATAVSVVAFIFFYRQGSTLGYKDTFSHLEIGRRIVVGQATGLGQLGGIWLPLQHILMIPLVWSSTLYYTGLAGSLISMGAYVICVVAVFGIVRMLTRSHWGAWTGAAVFGLNPEILYLQSTPMGEMLMYALLLLAVLCLIAWAQTDQYRYLLLGAVSTLAMSLVRYEGWVMTIVLLGVVFYACARNGYRFFRGDQKGQGLLLAFSYIALLGIIGWMLWNYLIFDDPLNWLRGQYSSREQMIGISPIQTGDLPLSIKTYALGLRYTLTIPVLLLSAIGLVFLTAREKGSVQSVAVLSLLVPGLFLVYGLYSNSQPMFLPEFNGELYNIRFSLVALLPCSVACGYLVGILPRRYLLRQIVGTLGIAAVATYSLFVFVSDPTNMILGNREAHNSIEAQEGQQLASEWIDRNTTGRVLIESFENERAVFDIQSRVVYEGSPDWEAALEDPTSNNISVIVMRTDSHGTDRVSSSLSGSPALDGWTKVYDTQPYEIYEREGSL